MRMSSHFTVAVQMLLMIVVFKEQNLTSGFISKGTGANPVLIRQLYCKLKAAGLLSVCTGRGVTMLSKAPEEISLWDIYKAVEKCDVNDLFKFHPNISPKCQVGHCFKDVLTPHLEETIQAMAQKMEKVTLRQLVEEWKALNQSSEV